MTRARMGAAGFAFWQRPLSRQKVPKPASESPRLADNGFLALGNRGDQAICNESPVEEKPVSQRADHRSTSGAWRDGVRLGLALVWVVGVLSCPDRVAGAFAGPGAAFFAGSFVLGAFVFCALRLVFAVRRGRGERGESEAATADRPAAGRPMTAASRPAPSHRAAALPLAFAPIALFAAVAAIAGWLVAAGPVPVPLAILGGLVAGAGEGAALLALARRPVAGAPADVLRSTGAAAVVATLLLCPLVAMGDGVSAAVTWGYLALVALATGVACLSSRKRALPADGLQTPACPENASESATPRTTVTRLAIVLKGGLWEPALGFGLSLMSTLLPWGAFFAGGPASTPPAWTFAVGMAAAGCGLLVAAYTRLAQVPFEVAVHVAMPVLAAAVVALRMLGDVGSSDAALSMVKGVASGVAAVGFAVFAWLAMGHAARMQRDAVPPYAAGFCAAFAVGAVILPLHGLNQSAASLAAPVLSLAFLVVTSCSSLGHLGHRGASETAGHAGAGPMSVEKAAERLAAERGLSPRETQVLVRLASGRSAEGIAEVLGISPNTVRAHVRSIHEKLQVSSRDQVVDAIEAARTQD